MRWVDTLHVEADDRSPRGRPVKFCADCGRNLTLGAFRHHWPCESWYSREKQAARKDWLRYLEERADH